MIAGTHGARRLYETDIALNRVQTHALDFDAFWPSGLAAIAPKAMEIAGRRGIGFDMDFAEVTGKRLPAGSQTAANRRW